MNNIRFLLMVTTSMVTGTANAQTPWPDFMPSLVHDLSLSSAAALLPNDVRIHPVAPDTLDARAAFSGLWKGWACQNRRSDTAIAVEQVTNSGATLVYAFAGQNQANPSVRIDATFEGKELHGTLASGASLTYRIRNGGFLEFLWQSKDRKQWAAGILKRQ